MVEAKRIITYSLLDGHKRSDQFYLDLAAFTAQVVAEGDSRVGNLVAGFQEFIQETDREKVRSAAEYLYELLTLGVLWQVYGSAAMELASGPQTFLAWLGHIRKKSKILKPLVDLLRGVLATLFVPLAKPNGKKAPAPSLVNLSYLIAWLDATGDSKEGIKRLQGWQDFFQTLSTKEAKANLEKAIAYALWFEESSLNALGNYTPQVDHFLSETHPHYRWREDRVFCGCQRVEYHLSMVGAEIMNQDTRQQFLNTQKKLVIVPPCMVHNLDGCEAIPTPWGDRCQACTPGCRVNQVTKLGEKYGFEVRIIPDDLAVYANGRKGESREIDKVGVIGVCCPLTVVSGHWRTKDLGVPAQGVLLDFCGCPWHWALDERVITDVNFNQLLRTLGLK